MRRWIAVGLWIFAGLAIIDTGISLALTCPEQSYRPGSGQNSLEDCSVFQGPVFRFLVWFADAFDKHGEAVIALFTIVLAISTIGLWWSTRKLWEAGEKQIAVAAFAANSSEQSARAAQRAAAIMDQTAERQLRAYISIEDGHIRNVSRSVGTVEIEIFINFKNSGQTPAYEFTIWSKSRICPAGDPPPFADMEPPGEIMKSIVGPGNAASIRTIRTDVNAGHLNALIKRDAIFYVWGRVDYVDAFRNPRHFIFRCTNDVNQFETYAWAIRPHSQGYEAN